MLLCGGVFQYRTMIIELGYVVFLFLLVPYIESANRLNEYIAHYEPLSYDVQVTQHAHNRVRRSAPSADDTTNQQQLVHVQFHAHARQFQLRLRRDTHVFSDRLRVDDAQGRPLQVDTAHIYHGDLIDEAGSSAFGSIIDGVFEGKIHSPTAGNYYVEKSHHYFPHNKHPNRTFHSVIYNEEHVHDPYEHLRHGHSGGCGITEEMSAWMERVQNSALDEETETPAPPPTGRPANNTATDSYLHFKTLGGNRVESPLQQHMHDYDTLYKYTYEANTRAHPSPTSKNTNHSATPLHPSDHRGRRWRRSTNGATAQAATNRREENRNTCSLYIQTDPLIWKHIREGFPEHMDPRKESEVNEKTREEILSLIAHHVTAVNYIYRDTRFDGRSEHRNIKFEVQRIKIDDDTSCRTSALNSNPPNQFCMENIDVSNFLNIHSLGNHEDFCLAYVFTYRDFTGGTLGLAWVASASGASGGICEKYKTYTETIGGMYQSNKRSLNTGIITFVNYNSRVPPKVSQLTLAHEIGHNFGSPHDYPPECRPGGLNGNFIMFASATSGDRPNNSKFSTCSVGNISNVLDAIEDNKKRNCFSASAGAFCGNKIVEAGEECDCGYDENECKDKCCYPRVVEDADLRLNTTAKGCHRRQNTQCSPSQGPCCNSDTCRFIPAWSHELCRTESECSRSSKCDGRSSSCPTPAPRPDKTRCNNGTMLCLGGECSGSICLEWNLLPCSLTSTEHPSIDKRQLCELACQNGTDRCRSTSEFAHLVGLQKGGISLRPGSPCDNFQGYCDVFLKCRAVDAEGPLVRLMNLLLNRETLLTVAQWITEYWWAVLLLSILFVIVMGLFIKCCAVHTPSSNPKKPPARRISETLRRPINTLRRVRNHHQNHASHSAGMHGGGGGGGGQGRSRSGGGAGGGGGGGGGRSGRPSASSHHGPRPGYGEGRGHHYTPKGAYEAPHHQRSGNAQLPSNAFEMRQKV